MSICLMNNEYLDFYLSMAFRNILSPTFRKTTTPRIVKAIVGPVTPTRVRTIRVREAAPSICM
jgi:hypothetical protein